MATAKLSWSSASQIKQIVPKSQLYSNTTPVATGNGLKGEYYNTLDFTGTALTRTDSVINFDWNNNPPFTGVNTDNYSVRWTGKVKANYSETYTFYTISDDGVRLWVNNTLLVDNWTNHAAVENSGTIALVAGQQYDIRMEYYDKTSLATAKLSWSSASQVKQIIPRLSLFLPAGARQAAASVNSFDINNSAGILTTYPNPAKDFVNVQFNSGKSGNAEIVLVNESSREVLKKSVSVTAGENSIPVSLSEVSSGMYVMVITIDGKKQATRIVVGK